MDFAGMTKEKQKGKKTAHLSCPSASRALFYIGMIWNL